MESEFPNKPGVGDAAVLAGKLGAGALLSAVVSPGLSTAMTEIISLVLPSPLQARQKEFIDDIARRLKRLEKESGELPFRSTEEFAAFVHGVLHSAAMTAESEKLRLFQNAILNAATGRVHQLDYLRNLLDALTVDHIRVLNFFAKACDGRSVQPENLARSSSELIVEKWTGDKPSLDYIEAIFRDVWSRCLLAFPHEVGLVLAPGEGDVYVLNEHRLSALGLELLAMVAEPENTVSSSSE